jgi:hypothetical protein
MGRTFNGRKKVSKFFVSSILILFILILLIFIIFTSQSTNSENKSSNTSQSLVPFSLGGNDITYYTDTNSNIPKAKINYIDISDTVRGEILNRAKAMAEVKWTAKYNLIETECTYTFIKGKTYQGVPYSMDQYQVTSPKDFLSKINNSKILYGNDCSGFVSASWGISRQTTLCFYNAIKNATKIDGKYVCQISWDDLKPADALLIDDGNGEGHIMLYINSDKKNTDNLNVYEQNIATEKPLYPIPAARKDVRSKKELMENGYIPIRLMGNT